MPELPEVETLRRALFAPLVNNTITSVRTSRRDLRFPLPDNFSRRLTGARITDLSRKGKYLLLLTDRDEVLLVHLGMSGNLLLYRPGINFATVRHTHVVFTLEDGAGMVYVDPRRFGFMDLFSRNDTKKNPYLSRLGMDPLTDELDLEFLRIRFRGSRRPLKNALMDQGIFAGLGNIYCCESLFRARLSPHRQVKTLIGKRTHPTRLLRRLLEAIDTTIEDALEAGGSSIRDYLNADGETGYFQHRFKVYGRAGESCPNAGCKGIIRRTTHANRSTFHCPRCQR